MSQAKLQAARELIQEKQFDAARAVLRTIATHPTASQWLKKLPKQRRLHWIIIVPIVTYFFGFAMGAAPTASRTSTPTPTREGVMVLASATNVSREPSSTITVTPNVTATINLSLTAQSAFVEGTQTAHVRNLEATIAAWTQRAPSPIPPFSALAFQGATGQVLGPISLPDGIYRARVTTDGFYIATLQVISGECGVGTSFLIPHVFNLTQGQARGAEAIIRSSGCTTYIETSNITTGWTLEISKIS